MSELDVRGCVAALVTAFDTGAHLTEVLMGKASKKKRKKKDKEVEIAVERRLLHRSLVESSAQCRRCGWDRHQQFGEIFALGDPVATSQLQTVLFTLQTEVVQVLQTACSREDSVTDHMTVYETTLTSRNNALRAMNELCQRIAGAAAQRPYHMRSASDPGAFQHVQAPVDHGHLYRAASPDESPTISPASTAVHTPTTSQYGPIQYSGMSRELSYATREPLAPVAAPRSNSGPPGYNWNSPPRKRFETPRSLLREISIQEDEEGEHGSVTEVSDQLSQASLGGMSSVGSDAGSRRHASLSISSVAPSEYQMTELVGSDTSNDLPPYRDVPKQDFSDSKGLEVANPVEDDSRALQAPEVVPPTALVHPAYRAEGKIAGLDRFSENVFDPEPDNVWSPLSRPARINNYHGFCKGAWDIRRNFREGLAIRVITQSGADGNLAQWACKVCSFKSTPVKGSEVQKLPDHVYYHAKTTIRYRWRFLAKSHVHAVKPSKKLESHPFGCIFCAAEGRPTAVYDKLDALMSHIHSKHKAGLLTVETRSRTNCVVGELVSDTWDVNLPGEKRASRGGAAGAGGSSASSSTAKEGFISSAVNSFARYGQSPVPICQ